MSQFYLYSFMYAQTGESNYVALFVYKLLLLNSVYHVVHASKLVAKLYNSSKEFLLYFQK